MFKDIFKKIIKSFLALCLLLTGALLTPKDIFANDVEPYAAVPVVRNESKTYYFSANNAGGINLTINWRYLTTGSSTQMMYVSSSCSHDSTGTCVVSGHSVQGQSFSDTLDEMVLQFTLNVSYNSNSYVVKYYMLVRKNSVVYKELLSVTKN